MNVKKCKTLVSDSWEDSREIRIESTEVENVEDFCYLGSWSSTNGNCDKDCQSGLAKPAVCLEGYKMYGGTNTSA